MNRSSSAPDLMPIDQMYKLTKRENEVWGVEGYEVPRNYLDPQRQIKEREYATQKKGLKTKSYITKRGHFLDDVAKQTKYVPGPQKYDTYHKWINEKDKDKNRPKSAPPANKNTFIDQIFTNEKKRGNPGVGSYNVTQTLEDQKKNQKKYGPKKCFLSDYEYIGDSLPGSGVYNPRQILPKVKMNNTKPDFWIKKHKEEAKKFLKSTLPDIGSYKPHPVHYSTFSKKLQLIEEKKVSETKVKYLGSEERFKDPKKSKSLATLKTPAPGTHDLIAHWPNKEDGIKKEKKFNWMNRITKGVQLSIYHA